MSDAYSRDAIDAKMEAIHEKLDLILKQTTKHNGRLTRQERIMLVVGTVVGVLLVTSGSSLVQFVMALIK